jgi:hypothetical protein
MQQTACKISCDTVPLSNPLVTLSASISHFPISSGQSPIVAETALDVIGWWVVQLCYHVSSGEFLLLLLECGKCTTGHYPITPRAFPATTGYWKEQQIQPIENKECEWGRKQVLIDQRAKWLLENGSGILSPASVNHCPSSKKGELQSF